jgi:hypothetical protein
MCVKDVLTKSMHKRGFDKIHRYYRDSIREDLEKRNLKKFVNRLTRCMRMEAFNKIKFNAGDVVDNKQQEAADAIN